MGRLRNFVALLGFIAWVYFENVTKFARDAYLSKGVKPIEIKLQVTSRDKYTYRLEPEMRPNVNSIAWSSKYDKKVGMGLFVPSAKYILGLVFLLTVNVKMLESSKMKVTGKVTVPNLTAGVSLAKESYLIVKLEDTSMMDAASILLGEQEQKLGERTKLGPGTEPLNYTIVCDKPEKIAPSYSVSAVLNMGWQRSEDEWLRKGDFLTDTDHPVHINEESVDVIADIEMVHYN